CMPLIRRGGVQRHREAELLRPSGELCERREDADRRDGDMTRADPEAVRVVENGECTVHGVPIEERLAHAHEYDVGRHQGGIEQHDFAYLPGDLRRREVPAKAHSPRGAEDTTEGAADL